MINVKNGGKYDGKFSKYLRKKKPIIKKLVDVIVMNILMLVF